MTRSIIKGVDRLTLIEAKELADFDSLIVGCTCPDLWVRPVTNFVGQLVEVEVAHDKGCPRLRQEVRR